MIYIVHIINKTLQLWLYFLPRALTYMLVPCDIQMHCFECWFCVWEAPDLIFYCVIQTM